MTDTEPEVGEARQPESGGFARNSALMLASTVVGNAGYFVGVLLLARVLGASGRGSIAFVIVTALVVGRVASFGIAEATTVFSAQRPRLRRELYTNALLFTTATGIGAAALIIAVLAEADATRPAGVDTTELAALGFGIVATAVSEANAGLLRGLGRFSTLALLTASVPWVYSAFLVVLLVGPGLTVPRAAAAWAAHAWVDALVGLVASARAAGLTRPVRSLAAEAIRFGARAWLGTLSGFLNARADQILMAFIATEAALGIYAVAVNVSETLLYLPAAAGLALLPRIASIGQAGRVHMTLLVFRRLILVTFAAAVVAAALGPVLLPLLFGEEFRASIVPFLLLVPGSLGYTALTVFTNALVASSAPGRSSFVLFVTLAVGVALDVVFIPAFGASGAAFAATAAFTVGGVLSAAMFHRREPFSPGLLLPRRGDAGALVRLTREAAGRLWLRLS